MFGNMQPHPKLRWPRPRIPEFMKTKAPKAHAKPHNQAVIDKTATSKSSSKVKSMPPTGIQNAKKARLSSPAPAVAMECTEQQHHKVDLGVWSLLEAPSGSSKPCMEADLK